MSRKLQINADTRQGEPYTYLSQNIVFHLSKDLLTINTYLFLILV